MDHVLIYACVLLSKGGPTREELNSSSTDALRQLSLLEVSSGSSSSGTLSNPSPSNGEPVADSQTCLAELQTGDISAVSRIAMQLYSGRPLQASPKDDTFWEWQVGRALQLFFSLRSRSVLSHGANECYFDNSCRVHIHPRLLLVLLML